MILQVIFLQNKSSCHNCLAVEIIAIFFKIIVIFYDNYAISFKIAVENMTGVLKKYQISAPFIITCNKVLILRQGVTVELCCRISNSRCEKTVQLKKHRHEASLAISGHYNYFHWTLLDISGHNKWKNSNIFRII